MADCASAEGCWPPQAKKECAPAAASCCGEGGGACGDGGPAKVEEEPSSSSDGGKSCGDAAAVAAPESVDVVISNCVINLTPDKRPVLSEAARILKPGGELYFSDVFADRRIPKHLRDDKVLFGECLSGALYVKDFGQLMSEVGLGAWGVVNHLLITANNEKILERVGDITFYSLTVRAIKVDPSKLEDALEDFGQTATYNGAIPGYEEFFSLDLKNTFAKGKPTPVDGLTASLILSSRYGPHFSVTEKGSHRGIFCGENAIAGGPVGWALFLAKEAKNAPPAKCGSCCC
ncbi:hypothetical protein CBR_g613 [Chara braunii]|uniref:Arsenite methyltransferase n=1 Tax=Chara braunii TaxID=69332 RepID=A0A388KBP1_CHABU|nr:hypothetical protein CBR_g613 [Chara braunii]|eukprot:GBG67478.1 hypothetical protein CBR_g613 [Chara braunii]